MTGLPEHPMPELKVISEMTPRGDQPQAIEQLVRNFRQGQDRNVLLGVTGSGKSLADKLYFILDTALFVHIK